MQFLSKIKKYFSKSVLPKRIERDPESAYDLWSANYDLQPGNLILDLDEKLFSELFNENTLENKIVADIGCGTGRHWKKILHKHPKQLIGFDVSEGMLEKLGQKFPGAITFKISDHLLPDLENHTCDLIISTLAIAHIQNIEEAFLEWNRILNENGEIIITDYHPMALTKGGDRTFRHNDNLITVKSYVHPLENIKALCSQMSWRMVTFKELKIDDEVRSYYEKQHALSIFEQYKNTPIIYGMRLKRDHVTQ
ncbi:MAG TPA: class I SAM-dependent methyltransferase [Puia sp.]|nr:class I SAM-dependent methyltransferase [Puia sp.]